MTFFLIVVKNLFRRPTRTVLTVAGIAIGVAAVVALTSIAWGFENTWVGLYKERGADLIVIKAGGLSPAPPPFDVTETSELRSWPHVAQTSGVMSEIMGIETAPIVLVFGWESRTFVWDHLRLATGRWPSDDGEATVVIGSLLADALHKTAGSPIQIETARFTICGVFNSGSMAESGAVVMMLPQLQRVKEQPGKVNFMNLKLAPDTTAAQVDALRGALKTRLPGFRAYTVGEVAEHNIVIQAIKASGWATSALALLIGSLSVMNTMLMTVFERTREMGILLAIGWRRRRIVRMILYESIALTLTGGVIGMAAGTVLVKVVQATPLLRGRIDGEFSPRLFGMAFLIAIALGVIGGLYPAYRASRMRPGDAMRHE